MFPTIIYCVLLFVYFGVVAIYRRLKVKDERHSDSAYRMAIVMACLSAIVGVGAVVAFYYDSHLILALGYVIAVICAIVVSRHVLKKSKT